MKKGIICYRSKYGAAKKYAHWLREALDYECKDTKVITGMELKEYDTIIICGGIYASGIAGLSFLKKRIGSLNGRKIAVFCVGASPYDEHALQEIKSHNLKGELRNIPLFYGRGIWDESKMKFVDRNLCRLLQKSVAKKNPSTYEPWMKALMSSVGQSCDWTDKKYLSPLLEYLD